MTSVEDMLLGDIIAGAWNSEFDPATEMLKTGDHIWNSNTACDVENMSTPGI